MLRRYHIYAPRIGTHRKDVQIGHVASHFFRLPGFDRSPDVGFRIQFGVRPARVEKYDVASSQRRSLTLRNRFYVVHTKVLTSLHRFNAKVSGHIEHHAARNERRNFFDTHFRQTGDGSEVLEVITIVEMSIVGPEVP